MSARSHVARLLIATALATTAAITPAAAQGGDTRAPRLYKGIVTANRLVLRSEPTSGSRAVGVARRGDYVTIYCRTTGQNVRGDRTWYRLTDGVWAWGSARYIATIGASPRWC
ncbi:SH3 domain-containing protein [Streptomyces griseus]|uniref:SH3 domain-containing protein n=1 Tax=Streptomyces griseus TaxID=1911 RepID=UPI00056CE30A|nr:SH3 domain-containing protein [Streptomyces griseus]